jgi:demethylmenaquinone methyltransferase/2-methoxy-6-polyprenyl-1,4-benzoquinol methylase
MKEDLVSYYFDRAKEYERIYFKPERQNDLKESAATLETLFKNLQVLEIACGTGYWTERIARTATSVLATDINAPVIEIAKVKQYENKNVSFEIADIYALPAGQYESLFGGFIWSHIKLQELPAFLEAVHKSVKPGGTVVFMDNTFVAGSNLPVTNTDEQGNTFQTRKLDDGSSHLVLKNFPDETSLKAAVGKHAENFRFIRLQYFWITAYTLRG